METVAVIGTALIMLGVFFKVARGSQGVDEFIDIAGNLFLLLIFLVVLSDDQGKWAIFPAGVLVIFHNLLHFKRM